MFKKTAGKVFEFLVPKPKVNKSHKKYNLFFTFSQSSDQNISKCKHLMSFVHFGLWGILRFCLREIRADLHKYVWGVLATTRGLGIGQALGA